MMKNKCKPFLWTLLIAPASLFFLPLSGGFSLFSLRGAEGGFELLGGRIAFSPNGDGVADGITVRPAGIPEPLKMPGDWTVRVRNSSGEVVRVFRADRRLLRPLRSLSNFYLPGRKSIRPLRLFSSLTWDGRNREGAVVPDGEYSLSLEVKDRLSGVLRVSEPLSIRVDTVPLKAGIEPGPHLVLLVGSRKAKEREGRIRAVRKAVLYQKATLKDPLFITGEVLDGEGRILLRREWKNRLPSSFTWNGTDAKGNFVKPGYYRYRLRIRDAAGNRARDEFAGILVSEDPVLADLRSLAPSFSPDGNGEGDSMEFHIVPVRDNLIRLKDWRERLGIRHWRFEVLPRNGEEILYSRHDAGPVPTTLLYDGRDDAGRALKEGRYSVRLLLDTKYGIHSSPLWPLVLDRSPPVLRLSSSLKRFSPDGDGEEDRVILKIAREDLSGIARWRLLVTVAPELKGRFEPLQKEFALFEGEGEPPELLEWDGTGEGGEHLESLEPLRVVLEATDRAGNRGRSRPLLLSTSVLFRPEIPGKPSLISRLPDQDYFNSRNELTPTGEEAVSRFLKKMKRYSRYRIRAEVHSSLKGREEESLVRTEERSLNLYRYILSRGMDPSRLGYRGMGESETVASEREEFGIYRNDRIQFRLMPLAGSEESK